MARKQSPGYPHVALPKALNQVSEIFEKDRRSPIDREVAVKHIGYSGLSGAADKALASLAHYDLVDRAGKGQLSVSQLAVDILHPEKPEDRKPALLRAAFAPEIFKAIRERFPDHKPSEEALKSWLTRQEFLPRAINQVTNAYLETFRYLEQEKAFESGSPQGARAPESILPEDETGQNGGVTLGGAEVGDLIQWESNGQLQFEQPLRVRHVSPDGQWVAVEGIETGLPMSEVIVEQKGEKPHVEPPKFPIGSADGDQTKTDEPNHFKIVLEGAKLQIVGQNIDLVGLRKLMKKLDKYSEILEMDEGEQSDGDGAD